MDFGFGSGLMSVKGLLKMFRFFSSVAG